MNIRNYKYNPETFEEEAYKALLKREEAEKKLTIEEKKTKKNIKNLSLNYYKAFLEYMHADNEHMATFLAYLKHEHEMLQRTQLLFFNNEELSQRFYKKIRTAEDMFNAYMSSYENLKEAEYELKEAIQSFERQMFNEDLVNLMSLHAVLAKVQRGYIFLQNTTEQYRNTFGFPFVEECLALRNIGLEYETYEERAKKLVEGNSEPAK